MGAAAGILDTGSTMTQMGTMTAAGNAAATFAAQCSLSSSLNQSMCQTTNKVGQKLADVSR